MLGHDLDGKVDRRQKLTTRLRRSRSRCRLMAHAALGEEVAQLFLLGLEIVVGVFGGGDLAGDALGHANAGALESSDLIGVVREQANLLDAESAENFGGHEELALIGFEAEALIRFDGIEATVLQGVGLQLGHETDTSAFLLLINENAGALLGDHGEGHFELLAAVAAQGTEDVSGEALGVDANERRAGLHVSHNQGNGLFRLGARNAQRKAVNEEMSPTRGEFGGRHLFCFDETHCGNYIG